MTTNKNLNTPANGADIDTWDVPMNANFNMIDAAFGGVTLLNVTSLSGTETLTATQYIPPIVEISGTLTAAVTYELPSGVGGIWTIANAATGAFNVIWASAAGGTYVILAPGEITQVFCDGTNVGISSSTSGGGGSTPQIVIASGTTLPLNNVSTFRTEIGALSASLPALSGVSEGEYVDVEDGDYNASVNNITINPNGSDAIDFMGGTYTSFIADQNNAVIRFVRSNGVWRVLPL